MTLVIMATVAAVVLAVIGLYASNCLCDFGEALAGWVSCIALVAALCGVVYILILGYGWSASVYKANIINREFGTEYTREEVFYASSVIDTIRELDRKRVEINGDILKE